MTELSPDTKARIARQFMEAIPHTRALSLRLDQIESGIAEVTMPFDEKLVGDPETGVIHGGAVSALMDTACGAAVVSHPASPIGTATIDLRIDYMRAAGRGEAITARAHCYHVTRSVAFVRATAYDTDRDRPVATVNAAFTVERTSKGSNP